MDWYEVREFAKNILTTSGTAEASIKFLLGIVTLAILYD